MLPELLVQETPHGLIAVFSLPHWTSDDEVTALVETLQGDERSVLGRYAVRRKVTYAGGRYALRRALQRLGASGVVLVANDRGAPILPAGYRGSISHKDTVVAVLAARDESSHIGIDIEDVPGPSDAIADKILTPAELAYVMGLPDAERALELSLRFSLKEAIYKALDPYVRRYVAYDEVEVWPSADGSARIVTDVLPAGRAAELRWQRIGDHVLTTARL